MAEEIEAAFGWMVTVSLQASVLVVLVLAVQAVLGRWLSPRWRHALWFIVLVRLAVPVLPESPHSIFNLFPALSSAEVRSEQTASVAAISPDGDSGTMPLLLSDTRNAENHPERPSSAAAISPGGERGTMPPQPSDSRGVASPAERSADAAVLPPDFDR